MWYKRYGYKQPASDGGGLGCFGLFFIVSLTFVPSAFLVVRFESLWFLLVWLVFSIGGFELVDRYGFKNGQTIRRSRRKKHLKSASKHIKLGLNTLALEDIRKACIYGELPDELKEFELQFSAEKPSYKADQKDFGKSWSSD